MERRPQQLKEQAPPMHPLENPFIWFLIQLAEFGILVLVSRLVLPRDWPWGVYVAIWFVLLIGLTTANYALRRRFIPR